MFRVKVNSNISNVFFTYSNISTKYSSCKQAQTQNYIYTCKHFIILCSSSTGFNLINDYTYYKYRNLSLL